MVVAIILDTYNKKCDEVELTNRSLIYVGTQRTSLENTDYRNKQVCDGRNIVYYIN